MIFNVPCAPISMTTKNTCRTCCPVADTHSVSPVSTTSSNSQTRPSNVQKISNTTIINTINIRIQQPWKQLKYYPVNQTITKLISRRSLASSKSSQQLEPLLDECKEHRKKIEILCLDDYEQICANCALFGRHRSHNVKSLEEVVQEINQRVGDTVTLFQELSAKVTALKETNIRQLIHEQFLKCINQSLKHIDEQFKELIAQLLNRQLKYNEEVEARYMAMEEQSDRLMMQALNMVIEKADLWLLSTQEKLINFSTKTEAGQIAYEILKDNNQIGRQIIQELDQCQQEFKFKLDEIPHAKTLLLNLQLKNIDILPKHTQQTQQSFYYEDPSILKDVSFAENFDFGLNNNYTTNQPNISNNQHIHTLPNNNILSPEMEQQSTCSSEKRRSVSPISRKRGKTFKMSDKVEQSLNLIRHDQVELIDLQQQELGDEGLGVLSEVLRGNSKLKVLKLMRNKISDEGLQRLLEAMGENKQTYFHFMHPNSVSTVHLQSNILTDRSLDYILNACRSKCCPNVKQVYLNQNLINASRSKKKVEEIKKLGVIVSL